MLGNLNPVHLQKPRLLHLGKQSRHWMPRISLPREGLPLSPAASLCCLIWSFRHPSRLLVLTGNTCLPDLQNLLCPSMGERGQKEVSSWSKCTLTNASSPHLRLLRFKPYHCHTVQIWLPNEEADAQLIFSWGQTRGQGESTVLPLSGTLRT